MCSYFLVTESYVRELSYWRIGSSLSLFFYFSFLSLFFLPFSFLSSFFFFLLFFFSAPQHFSTSRVYRYLIGAFVEINLMAKHKVILLLLDAIVR